LWACACLGHGGSVPPSVPNALSQVLDRERVGKAFERLFPRVMRRLVRNSKPDEDFVRACARVVADEPYGGAWYDERSPWPVLEPLTPWEPVKVLFSPTVGANLFRRRHRFLLEISSRTDLVGAFFAEGFVYFDLDAPPYPPRNRLHAGEDSYLEISVRPS
jgi:hypothetical protein